MPHCNGERRNHSSGKRSKEFPVIVDKTKAVQKKNRSHLFSAGFTMVVLVWSGRRLARPNPNPNLSRSITSTLKPCLQPQAVICSCKMAPPNKQGIWPHFVSRKRKHTHTHSGHWGELASIILEQKHDHKNADLINFAQLEVYKPSVLGLEQPSAREQDFRKMVITFFF